MVQELRTLLIGSALDPLFRELGWDVENTKNLSIAQRDVSHEYSIKIEGDDVDNLKSRAPDYAFRIGENDDRALFFVEAKKPSVNVHNSTKYAFQTREYGWSAGLPFCVLTDFEEFAVYDCRFKPIVTDGAEKARVNYFTCNQYDEKWDIISGLFGRDAVKRGVLSHRAAQEQKRGTETVDEAFLKLIKEWRVLLAKDLAWRNQNLTSADLNYAVQMIIDRIVFLRMAEDRDLEPWGTLQKIGRATNVYAGLIEKFVDADDRYNSGLFHFSNQRRSGAKKRSGFEDVLTPGLVISDDTLSNIIGGLYRPNPFNFRVIPIEILGQVYEEFLSEVITLSETLPRIPKIDKKPSIRKAGGVFYTPSYIVEEIIKSTVGKLCVGKHPNQIDNLRILDPACGSGSFLLSAYSYLLNWHLEFYSQDAGRYTKGKKSPLFETPDIVNESKKVYRLTTREKKRILVNNIYGVDIDRQAVEVTKLSLLLKVLEDESNEGLRLLNEPALPDLDDNIRCGNSLIGSDFYDVTSGGVDRDSFSDEEQQKINDFDWNGEYTFLNDGEKNGFDAVIGNPPWVSLTGKFRNEICSDAEIRYMTEKFGANTYMPNLYEYFVSQGLNLTCDNGYFSFITPDRLGYNDQFINLRERMAKETEIVSLIYKMPFPKVVADTLVFSLVKRKARKGHDIQVSQYGKEPIQRMQSEVVSNPRHTFEYFEDEPVMRLAAKIKSAEGVERLADVCKTTSGFGGKSEMLTREKLSGNQIAVLKGDSIKRYVVEKSYWFEFDRKNITGRTTDRKKLGATPKILLRKTGDSIIATYEESGIFPEQSLYFLFDFRGDVEPLFLLGLLNSNVLGFYYKSCLLTNKDSIAQVKKIDLDELPIRIPSVDVEREKNIEKEITASVRRLMGLHSQIHLEKNPATKTRIRSLIVSTQNRIDLFVAELYGIGEDDTTLL